MRPRHRRPAPPTTAYGRQNRAARLQGWSSPGARQRDRATARKMFRGVRPDQLDEAAAFIRDWQHTKYPYEHVQSMYRRFCNPGGKTK